MPDDSSQVLRRLVSERWYRWMANSFLAAFGAGIFTISLLRGLGLGYALYAFLIGFVSFCAGFGIAHRVGIGRRKMAYVNLVELRNVVTGPSVFWYGWRQGAIFVPLVVLVAFSDRSFSAFVGGAAYAGLVVGWIVWRWNKRTSRPPEPLYIELGSWKYPTTFFFWDDVQSN
jgi:hypothetical protein